jgi:hypothetical protein
VQYSLAVDRSNPDVLYHLGAISRRLGDEAGARRYFRRCRAVDPAEKWRFEIERELGGVPRTGDAGGETRP